MNDLSPEARSLLVAARAGGVPTAARRHNIKHAVLLRAAAVTAVSAGVGAAGATSLTAKLVLAGVLASVVSGGAFGVWKLWGARETGVTLPAPVARTLPVADKTRPSGAGASEQSFSVTAERPRAVNAGHEPARSVASKTPAREPSHLSQTRSPSTAPPPSTEKGLAEEVAQLRRAHEALRDDNPALALRILADYDHEFPRGALTEERGAIAAIAACQAQPGPRAQAQAQSFLQKVPSSLLGERVRIACFPGLQGSRKVESPANSR
jgi:hypothetical protein